MGLIEILEFRNQDSGTILIITFDKLGHISSKMPPKRRPSVSSSGSLSPPPEEPKAKKTKTKSKLSSVKPAPDDTWQQITKPEFVDRYRVEGAQDVYYQPEVGLPSKEGREALRIVHRSKRG
jgi:hypothetical protein